MYFGNSQYGCNIYGSTENGGAFHRLLSYITTYSRIKGLAIGLLGRTVAMLGVTKSGI